mmetsp:Transcript_3477/g.14357  ORF Transcript_3477/g.14357 Transcript_3477/m.14357 type:complete len:253 (+) Transcript_3477:704-1462(+)
MLGWRAAQAWPTAMTVLDWPGGAASSAQHILPAERARDAPDESGLSSPACRAVAAGQSVLGLVRRLRASRGPLEARDPRLLEPLLLRACLAVPVTAELPGRTRTRGPVDAEPGSSISEPAGDPAGGGPTSSAICSVTSEGLWPGRRRSRAAESSARATPAPAAASSLASAARRSSARIADAGARRGPAGSRCSDGNAVARREMAAAAASGVVAAAAAPSRRTAGSWSPGGDASSSSAAVRMARSPASTEASG